MAAMDRPTINRLATGAPGSITLGGKSYQVGQPTDQDHAALGSELEKIAQRLRQAKLLSLTKELGSFAAAREFLDATEPALAFDGVDDKASGKAFQRTVQTAAGCRHLAWLLIRKHQADVGPDTFDKSITDRNAGTVALELMKESGMLDLNPNSGGGTGSSPAVPTLAASATT